tara:strand:- start:53 stop:328 length:276 start_codon:yes stop_codon:yes gene_type:complete
MTITNLFTNHPASVNESYVEHMEMSGTFAFWLLVAGFCALVHAVFPFLFEKTGSRIITGLHGRMVTNRIRNSAAVAAPISRVHQALDSAAL